MQNFINIFELNAKIVPAPRKHQYLQHIAALKKAHFEQKTLHENNPDYKQARKNLESAELTAFKLCSSAAKLALCIRARKNN